MNKKGIIGILALFLMFALVLFGAAVALVTKSHYKNMVNRADGIKSLYIAEAGMERGIWKLRNDSSSQDTGVLYSNEKLGDGFYTVVIKEIDKVNGDTEIILESTGVLGSSTQGRGERRIQGKILIHNLSVIDLFNDYALSWGNTDNTGSLSLNNSVDVTRNGDASGDVFANGDISINQSSKVDPGLVYSTGTVSGDGTYTSGGVPDPVPPFPNLDTTYYDNEINTASGKPHNDEFISGTYNLGGNTLYVNGDVIVVANSKVVGPGKIVATGDITIGNQSTVTSGVELIADGDLDVGNSAEVTGDNNRLYSSLKVSVENLSDVEAEIITPKDIKIGNNVKVKGIIYAGGESELKNSSEIYGSIISDEFKDGEITNSVTITHDKGYIPSSSPPGLTVSGNTNPKAILISYEELPLK